MTDRITKKDVDAVIENLNKSMHIKDNGLKLRYYSSCGSYRVVLILNLETYSEKEYKHELKHRGIYISLLNFQNLLWIFERNCNSENTLIDRDTVIQLLDYCGFTYYR